jgi:hypothetical protein
VAQALIDGWNIQGLNVFQLTNYQHSLTGAKQSYTMGPTGDFPTVRPVRIEAAGIIRAGVRTRLDILNSKQWAEELSRSATDILPQKLYNDNSFDSSGRTTLYFLPIPSDANCTADLFIWSALSTAFALADPVNIPPGYLKAIQYNLAIDLAPAFSHQPDALTVQIAAASMQAIRDLNARLALEIEARPPMQPAGPQGQ